MYRLREERDIEPETMANLVSSSLYEKRFGPFYVSPVIAGINQHTKEPFVCGFDSIGCINFAKDFIVSGTASDQLFGTCESLWEPDMEPEDLFETISQALLNSVDRDALSGWGAHVYVVTKDKVIKRLLKGSYMSFWVTGYRQVDVWLICGDLGVFRQTGLEMGRLCCRAVVGKVLVCVFYLKSSHHSGLLPFVVDRGDTSKIP